jgi:transcriptional regulator with XRE-family HTH domain
MANDNLRRALEHAKIQPDELAEIVKVDIRTVRRWLSGTTPHPRLRVKIARALDSTEHQLWPGTSTAPPAAARRSDPIASYPSATDLAAPNWTDLIRDATAQIDLLGTTLTTILATPGLPELLAAKARHQCQVRILVSEPGSHLAPFIDANGIEIRLLDHPPAHTIYRIDDQLLLILRLQRADDDRGPLLHLRRAAAGGLFDVLAAAYDQLWSDVARPLTTLELSPQPEAQLTTSQALNVGRERSDRRSALSSPRRWPGRPS